jgi:hypothetical protein
MDADYKRMILRLLLGPACLAVTILILAAQADYLYLIR